MPFFKRLRKFLGFKKKKVYSFDCMDCFQKGYDQLQGIIREMEYQAQILGNEISNHVSDCNLKQKNSQIEIEKKSEIIDELKYLMYCGAEYEKELIEEQKKTIEKYEKKLNQMEEENQELRNKLNEEKRMKYLLEICMKEGK